jgi:hypothetical protein
VAINASIITDTAKEITKRSVVDYGAGVFAHTTQDWIEHNVVRVYPTTQFISSGAVVSPQSLRLVATRDDGSTLGADLALVVPIFSAGTNAITNAAPIIIQQPADRTAPAGTFVQIQVAAISDIAMTFQWQKLISGTWTDIAGATATNLVLTNVTGADTASYRVIVTNDNGSTVSNAMTLTVTSAGGGQDNPWYESLPHFVLFDLFDDLF